MTLGGITFSAVFLSDFVDGRSCQIWVVLLEIFLLDIDGFYLPLYLLRVLSPTATLAGSDS